MQNLMSMATEKAPRIGLVELPVLKLIDPEGKNWNPSGKKIVLSSKQILLANLRAGGFDAQLVDLRADDYEEEYGEVTWRGIPLSKRYSGTRISSLDPESFDAWGVTNNFTQNRTIALMVIRHLASGTKPVIVGGSDAIAEPKLYLQAGAAAVVTDKSGAANWPILDYLLNRPMREPLSGAILADGTKYSLRLHPMTPEEWPLPSLDIVEQCLGYRNPNIFDPGMNPIGSVIPDMGCDRKCDFCQTPTYGTGYKRMSPQRALQWYALQKEAGARMVSSLSDQFLGRVLFKDGKQEILDIMKGIRDLGLAISWLNGLELRKATKGRGYDRHSDDLTPDLELVEAVWGWDGKVGTYEVYIPAERPVFGRESYAKLLPWQQHREMVRAIVQAGVPRILYGVIVGLPDDNHESMLRLEEALSEIYQEVKTINPSVSFDIDIYAISPLPGTPQGCSIAQSGLLRFEDPEIRGGFMTACADTHHMSYEEVSDWQFRLESIGNWEITQPFVNVKSTK
ncbi:radical SAM protein [Aerosakkonema funiforme]|nr:radical SAM protein [Aerosakkonema funiforme]